MLACHYPRRQDSYHLHPADLPSPSPSHASSFFDNIPFTTCTPSASDFNEKLLRSYLQSTPAFAYLHNNATSIIEPESSDADQYMTAAYDFQNPAIRIQQSTPVPQLPTGYSQNNDSAQSWGMYGENNGQMGTPSSLQTPGNRSARTHLRAASSSSIGSNGSASQYNPSHTTGFTTSSNRLPTPSQTPTQDSFLTTAFQNYPPQISSMDATMPAHMTLKQALLDQHSTYEDDVPGFSHSARHSVSSYGHDSPATPQTVHGEDLEGKFKVPPNDMMRHKMPKFNRIMTDVYQDELYNPANAQHVPPSTQPSTNPALLSPYRNMVAERLQAAHNARSQSPASSASRGVSPFRQGSPHAPIHDNSGSPHARIGSAAHMREQQKADSNAFALKQQLSQVEDIQPKTISPKDAMLDYHESEEDSKMPLFPDNDPSEYEQQYNGGEPSRNATHTGYDNASEQSYGSMATSQTDGWATPRRLSSSNFSATSGSSPTQSTFTFVPPSIPGSMHGIPFTTQQYRSISNMSSAPGPTPDFPVHRTSMESSSSDAGGLEPSSAESNIQKPAATQADTGTYTCTYHGCTLRFETPQKLQKHKRKGHRQNPTSNAGSTPGVGSGMTSAALLARNSQAGPHKCERINPTTDKPCNTIFSRPYDLTRHEDTIHNARKQKVRCALCVEEKTFSRNDALTRHMRVVHPEVDFPGKHRRRGEGHD